jgi:hypothetical protein
MADTKEHVSNQPQGTAPMSVGGNRNAKNCPLGPDGKRGWSFGLFDCFARCGLCCWAVWCPCVVYGKNRQRLRSLQNQGTPLPGGGERYDGHCCVYGAINVATGHARALQAPPGRFRFTFVNKFGSAMAFMEARLRIASHRGSASCVLSLRNAAKLSWRRTVSR